MSLFNFVYYCLTLLAFGMWVGSLYRENARLKCELRNAMEQLPHKGFVPSKLWPPMPITQEMVDDIVLPPGYVEEEVKKAFS